MSQAGRQDFTDKAHDAMKPDSQKTFGEQIGDTLQGKGDSMMSTLQPQQEKTTTQKMGDAVSGNQNHNPGERSLLDKAKDAVGMGDKASTNN
ncbi:hypothetical protein FRC14_004776 [Serendipita sp. 396]|nr:hypothetical protein FRC14_004776 [Serendipita sp. 396]KAG8789343.1 hypothetical protein FRC15_009395 [Serendipita sp. 397]KAG8804577.1 hypothetical protein FRC16_006019 [Serendipita sp. 398]KAG8844976.1 hypothetical protein FRB91_002196 [Serendipita sp. 411]KAG8878699.1 hypothetical protein FRC20_006376 [Serendipita sp. 405]